MGNDSPKERPTRTAEVTRRRFLQQTGNVVAGGLVATSVPASSRAAEAGASPGNERDESQLPDLEQPDVIFIGAGVNSLGASVVLAQQGWRVVVLDRNDEPGGAVRTMELTLPGFRHDIGAMNLSLLAGSPFYAEYGPALARKGLELIVADHPFGSLAHDGRFLGMSTDLEANLTAIAGFSPADAKAWKTWRADYDRCSPTLFEMFGSPAAASGPLELIFGQHRDLPPEAANTIRGILLDSLRTNLSRRFESDVVQALIAAWALHLDYAPDVAGGCWMPFLETNGDERRGIPIARGGSGNMIQALVALLRDAGGRVVTQQTVQEILVEKGKAVGVRVAGGGELRCSRAVVASVTPQALVQLAGRHLPKDLVGRANDYRFGPGTLVIHLALSGLPVWRDEAARRSFYVHVAPSLDYIAAAYQEAMAGLLPREPFLVVAQPTLYDPSRAPAGKHVLWIMARGVPAEIRGDAAGIIEQRAWTPEVSEAFANRILRQLSAHAPGLRESILGMAVHTPSDLQRLNPNLVGGDLNAGSVHLSQFYGNRPLPELADYETPIPGLYMCGASTWPGGGASPGSGVMLARKLMAGDA